MLNLDFRWRLCMWLLLKMFHSVLSAFYKYFWRLNFYRFRYALWTTEWNLRPMLCLPFNIYTLHTNGLVEHSNRKSETTRNELDACCVGRNENMKMDFYLKMVKRSLFRTNFKLKQKKNTTFSSSTYLTRTISCWTFCEQINSERMIDGEIIIVIIFSLLLSFCENKCQKI